MRRKSVRHRYIKKFLVLLLGITFLVQGFSLPLILLGEEVEPEQKETEVQSQEVSEAKNVDDTDDDDAIDVTFYHLESYDDYLERYASYLSATPKDYVLQANDFSNGENIDVNDEGNLVTQETGYAEWIFDVDEAGLYQIAVDYYPTEGRGASIEREIYLNGVIPFDGANHILFSRIWQDHGEIRQDNRGNDIRPQQIEAPRWTTTWCVDSMGYYDAPYFFYLEEGENTLRLASVREPMILKSLTIGRMPIPPSYDELAQTDDYAQENIYQGDTLKFQAEDAYLKSDATLYAINDRSSPTTEPTDVMSIKLNSIGGYRWNQPGQWITWKVEVPEDGLYQLAFKCRQNVTRGVFSSRRLLVDGEVPFQEAEQLRFYYSTDWHWYVLGQGKEREATADSFEPQLLYLTEGVHELTLEVILGDFSEVITQIEESLFALNEAYRKIIMLTSTNPDYYRDYKLEREMPEVIELLGEQAQIISEMGDKLEAITGERGSQSAILYTLSYQLEKMYKKPHEIPRVLTDFKTNIGALGTWIITATEKPLELDYFILSKPKINLPQASGTFSEKLSHELSSFVASFIVDYSAVGNVYEESQDTEPLTLWMQGGRDQSQVLKLLIDDYFTPQTGIQVNLQLVQPGTLLPATVAGIGPDAALNLGGGEPVNFASRNAAVNLREFADFNEVYERFAPSAFVPYIFEEGVYALPETQTFPMLYYRKDILGELGLSVPQTWDELMMTLSVIQKNNLEFGIPVATTQNPEYGMFAFWMFLYQNDGDMYAYDGAKSALDQEPAIEAFDFWTSLYLNYQLPKEYDFVNRFRIGEMPLGIADYQNYNTLSVFAPEIRGLWEMIPIPGKEKGETLDRSCGGWGQNAMILDQSDQKEDAWEFLKWWTSAETQEQFGREMESLLGAAARYPTANLEAVSKLPWPVKDYDHLMEQWSFVQGTPEVPGGYYTARHVNNAFRQVVFQGDDPREVLLDYVRDIDDELTAKRTEFGLATYKDMVKEATK